MADTGYSSGENYALLEMKNLKSFIPPHGTYKGGPSDMVYVKEHDHYLMPTGQGDTFQESVPGQPHQDQKESVPCIENDLQGLCAQVVVSGQG